MAVDSAQIRTVQIGMSASSGGLNRYFFNLLSALPQAGVSAIGFVSGDSSARLDAAPGLHSFADAHDSIPRRWLGVRRSISSQIRDVDLIVAHFALYALPVLDLTVRRPLVVHFHGPWALESAREGAGPADVFARAVLERVVYARARRFIVLSNAFADVLESRYGIARRKIDVIRGGVDLNRFRDTESQDEARARLKWPLGRRIVTTVRRLMPSKGIESLIDAAVSIRARHTDVLVQIAGTGPLREALARRIEGLGLSEHVRLCGFVQDNDLPSVYRASDLFVVPSLAYEGFGLVVIEALASGTPVLVTPVGGLPEAVSALDPQMILPDASPSALANGVSAFLSGSLQLADAASCRRYAEGFAWPAVASEIANVYRRALASGRE